MCIKKGIKKVTRKGTGPCRMDLKQDWKVVRGFRCSGAVKVLRTGATGGPWQAASRWNWWCECFVDFPQLSSPKRNVFRFGLLGGGGVD